MMRSTAWKACVLALVLLPLGACTDVARNNPLDPGFEGTVRIEGPSVITSLNTTVELHIVPWTRAEFEWTSSDPVRAPVIRRSGVFVPLTEGTFTITATYEHLVLTHVITVQLPAPPAAVP